MTSRSTRSCAAVITTPANGYVTSSTVTPAVTFTGADTTSVTLNGVPFTLGDEISADGLYTLVASLLTRRATPPPTRWTSRSTRCVRP